MQHMPQGNSTCTRISRGRCRRPASKICENMSNGRGAVKHVHGTSTGPTRLLHRMACISVVCMLTLWLKHICSLCTMIHLLQINKDPYKAGWLIKVKLSNKADLNNLLDAAAYKKVRGHLTV